MGTNGEKFTNRWRITRQKGMGKFIVMDGALGWGVPTALLWVLIMHFINPAFSFAHTLPVALVLFPLGGLVWGWAMWRFCERKFLHSP